VDCAADSSSDVAGVGGGGVEHGDEGFGGCFGAFGGVVGGPVVQGAAADVGGEGAKREHRGAEAKGGELDAHGVGAGDESCLARAVETPVRQGAER